MPKNKEHTTIIKDINNAPRFNPDPSIGLTLEQVKKRHEDGFFNENLDVKTKSVKEIIFGNVFTFFNIINIFFAFLILFVGFFTGLPILDTLKNMTFMGVIFSNIAIGSFQEIRSKMIIDKLSLISASKANIIRESEEKVYALDAIVLDDVIVLSSGKQIPCDCIILDGEIEVNESLITGESDSISKKAHDQILSGSFVVSGTCRARVENVGAHNYASKIVNDAKYVKTTKSKIVRDLDLIVKIISFTIVPVGLALFFKEYLITGESLSDSVFGVVAAIIGMIPEGLVLLTSVVFALSVIRLALRKTLVQELYCIENLARVDILCLDKTGTITEGTMQVDEVVSLSDDSEQELKQILTALTLNIKDNNATFNAIKEFSFKESDYVSTNIIPFSSERKWSGASFKDKGSFVMGAPEFVFDEIFFEIKEKMVKYQENGQRVLVLAKSSESFGEKSLPSNLEPIALVVISDKIRKEAPDTLRYFKEQGVEIKVISGDNALTVSQIAKRAGVENYDNFIDTTTLKTDEEIIKAAGKYTVFGRVTPHQKLLLVKSLKNEGHTVAMTGDGVNDVLALKESDCSIAMASGSDAARTVADLVLMDSNFASMPLVVREGRRSINNLQRSASLFLTKTIYSVLMSFLFIFITASYPFQPIQMTVISTLTIGVPSFILALEPNNDRLKGSFMRNVLARSFPTGLVVFFSIGVLAGIQGLIGISENEMSTVAVITMFIISMQLIITLCNQKFTFLRIVLILFITFSFAVVYGFFPEFFNLVPINTNILLVSSISSIVCVISVILITHLFSKMHLSDFKRFSHFLYKIKHKIEKK